ncbi:MAG: hypothetical protein JWL71_683 [Acidobacteria bacterium]|nr:hypothetical protein [Acidobacteriota bacterium]
MKHALAVIGGILAALVCALTGAYVLWQFHSTAGLGVGVGLILLGVGIALPIPLKSGVIAIKENSVLIIPVIRGAIKGGDRPDDPPADRTTPPIDVIRGKDT